MITGITINNVKAIQNRNEELKLMPDTKKPPNLAKSLMAFKVEEVLNIKVLQQLL